MADYGIAVAIEHGNFVVMGKYAFPAFVVEHDDVIGLVLFIVDYDLGTAFAERLDDLRGLRTGAAAAMAGEAAARTAAVACHLPGLAIGDKDSRFSVGIGCLGNCRN